MRGHLHADRLAGSLHELTGERLRFAGQSWELLTGGAGMAAASPVAPPNANGILAGAAGQQHVGVIGLVLLAAIVLIILDRAGFRFAVTAGKR